MPLVVLSDEVPRLTAKVEDDLQGIPPEVTSCVFGNLSLASFQGRVVLKLCPSLFALHHPDTTAIISQEERWRSQASCPDPVLRPQF